MRKFKIGKYVVPLWIVAVLLISGVGASAYYVWQTLTVQLEVKEPLEILSYPSQLSLYPGEIREFNVTIRNHASVNYSVLLDFSLDNTTYQSSYVTFSNEIYTVIPGQQNLTSWLTVGLDAPSASLTLMVDCRRGPYPFGLVGYWRFDEGSGAIAFDSSINNNHGILVNGPLWVDGKYGKALEFDGASNYVKVEDSSSLHMTDAVTVMAWTRVDGATGDYQIICARWYGYGGEAILSFVLEFRPDGNTPWFRVRTTSNDQAAISNRSIAYGEWAHIAGTYDGNIVRIYVDGALVGSTSLSGPINLGVQPIVIGAHSSAGDRNFFKGAIDNVMVYNRALTAEEVQAVYARLLP